MRLALVTLDVINMATLALAVPVFFSANCVRVEVLSAPVKIVGATFALPVLLVIVSDPVLVIAPAPSPTVPVAIAIRAVPTKFKELPVDILIPP